MVATVSAGCRERTPAVRRLREPKVALAKMAALAATGELVGMGAMVGTCSWKYTQRVQTRTSSWRSCGGPLRVAEELADPVVPVAAADAADPAEVAA